MKETEIKKEALKRYCEIVISGLPFKWVDSAIDLMLNEKQDEPIERIKELIDFVIEETKKLQAKEAEREWSNVENT